jgi:hypothetical protein
LWEYLKLNPFWRLFVIPKPGNHSTTIDNNTLLWLPFFNVEAKGTGESMVAGDVLPGDRSFFSSLLSNGDRLHYQVDGEIKVAAAIYSGETPLSRGLLYALGLEPRSKIRDELLGFECEEITCNHQIPKFNLPVTKSDLDSLGQEAILHDTIDRFDEKVSVCIMLDHGITFSEVSVSLIFVPVQFGAINVEADEIERARYAFLGIGDGNGIADIPVAPLKKKLWIFGFWVALFLVFGIAFVMYFCIIVGFDLIETFIICFGLMYLLRYTMRLIYSFIDRRVKIDLLEDQQAIDHFTTL